LSSVKALKSSGSLFHSFGAAAAKPLSPYVLVLVDGIAKRCASDDLRARDFGVVVKVQVIVNDTIQVLRQTILYLDASLI
jgi:hypothetical protein